MSNSTYIEDDDDRRVAFAPKKPDTEGKPAMREIPAELYERLDRLGMLPNDVRDHNRGASDYSQHLIQPWAIWQEYGLNPFDADIIKRVLRHKATDPRRLDYEKIIHICQERIRQIDHGEDTKAIWTNYGNGTRHARKSPRLTESSSAIG